MDTMNGGCPRPPYPRLAEAIWLTVFIPVVQFAVGSLLVIPLSIWVILIVLTGPADAAERLDQATPTFLSHPATLAGVSLVFCWAIMLYIREKAEAPSASCFPAISKSCVLATGRPDAAWLLHCSGPGKQPRNHGAPTTRLAEGDFETLVGGPLWGALLAVVIVAPLTEELLFRGVILRGLLLHYSAPKAVIASSLMFGLVHLNPWQAVRCSDARRAVRLVVCTHALADPLHLRSRLQ